MSAKKRIEYEDVLPAYTPQTNQNFLSTQIALAIAGSLMAFLFIKDNIYIVAVLLGIWSTIFLLLKRFIDSFLDNLKNKFRNQLNVQSE